MPSTIKKRVEERRKAKSKTTKARAKPYKVKPKAASPKHKSKTTLGKKIDKTCSKSRRPAACAKLGKTTRNRKNYM